MIYRSYGYLFYISGRNIENDIEIVSGFFFVSCYTNPWFFLLLHGFIFRIFGIFVGLS
jgi:hypothetical protein